MGLMGGGKRSGVGMGGPGAHLGGGRAGREHRMAVLFSMPLSSQ
jgi:hypothetical protein